MMLLTGYLLWQVVDVVGDGYDAASDIMMKLIILLMLNKRLTEEVDVCPSWQLVMLRMMLLLMLTMKMKK